MSEFFPEVKDSVPYEGPETDNPLAFRWYEADRKVGDKTMAEHLKFAIAYWHTMKGDGSDPFGGPVYDRSWNKGADEMEIAEKTQDAIFEFCQKIGVDYYCFHDRDIAPAGDTIEETNANLQHMVDRAQKLQEETGVQLLWGTACLFDHPRYSHGAATNPDPDVFAYAASQVRRAIDATVQLGGDGYVFWGGREGYTTLLNTDMKREREQMARMLHMAADYGRSNGFDGVFLIEPKPKEPTTHQYDFDVATCLEFLHEFDLLDEFKMNVEANHATLAGHTYWHDLATASNSGHLGSMDVNRGNPILGWDTDQFPTNLYSATHAMLVVLEQGGLDGGMNFDAKVRRGSFDTEDLFHAHIGGMDAFARALLVANKIREDGVLDDFIQDRYSGYESGIGKQILNGETSLPELEEYAIQNGEPELISGRQEMLENILNDYLLRGDL
ncbi:MAG: xylose isomerase [Planctomycetes bacterium]|nr:xylose isomerase [Planctomycetota bacterium]